MPTPIKLKEEKIREKLSKILIKWGMPTRQVAISEIIELVSEERRELEEKIEGLFKRKMDSLMTKLEVDEFRDNICYNQALQDILSLLRGE